MKNIWKFCLCFCLCLGLLAGCKGNGGLKEIEDRGYLKIGVTECAPYCQEGPAGGLFGFDVELAQMVCEEMGIHATFVQLDWGKRMEALANGDVDCLWSGITAQLDETGTVEYTRSYLTAHPVVVTMDGNTNISKVGVEAGSAMETAARFHLPDAEIQGMITQAATVDALAQGSVDAIVVDALLARDALLWNNHLTILETPDLGTVEIAAAVPAGSELRGIIDGILETVQADGRLDTLANSYRMHDNLVVG